MNICVFGDSIVQGQGDPLGGGWVGRMRRDASRLVDPQTRDRVRVQNLGLGGNRVSDVSGRIVAEAAALKPDVIVLAVGMNDIASNVYEGTEPGHLAAQFNELLRTARHLSKDVIVVTPTNVDEAREEHHYRNADIAKVRDIEIGCARRMDVPVIDAFGIMTPQDLRPDGMHPGPQGHTKLFQTIAPALFSRPLLATYKPPTRVAVSRPNPGHALQ
jgi:lysophospholipase L1-like esterase